MKLSLVVTQGKLAGKEIQVRLSQFLIGRDPECQLRPNSPLVSKRHCAVLTREGRVFLRDFESTNGTILNDVPLKGEVELQAGDEFKVGPLAFLVKLEATVVDKPDETPTQASKSKPPPAAKAQDPRVNEDSVLEMLLTSEGGGPVTPGQDPIPAGSTVMESMSVGSEGGTPKPEEKADAKKPDKKIADAKATSDAAKAILDKYMRRPRG
jgi:pSer/pThr/pTyr-binding forkhead associated (FHA) protein